MEIKIVDYWNSVTRIIDFSNLPHQSCFLLYNAGLARSFSHGDVSVMFSKFIWSTSNWYFRPNYVMKTYYLSRLWDLFFLKNGQNFIKTIWQFRLFCEKMNLFIMYSEYMMALRIEKSRTCIYENTIVIFVYLPPKGSAYCNTDSILELGHEILPLSNVCCPCRFYIMGDFNARTGISVEFNDFDLSHSTADWYGTNNHTISCINNAHELCPNSI